jgi:hypothetical protein
MENMVAAVSAVVTSPAAVLSTPRLRATYEEKPWPTKS